VCLIVCDLETSEAGALGPSWAVVSQEKEEEERRKNKSDCIAWEKQNNLSIWKY